MPLLRVLFLHILPWWVKKRQLLRHCSRLLPLSVVAVLLSSSQMMIPDVDHVYDGVYLRELTKAAEGKKAAAEIWINEDDCEHVEASEVT